MKKPLALLLAALMSLSVLAACGAKEETPETPETPVETPGEEEPAEDVVDPLVWAEYDALY